MSGSTISTDTSQWTTLVVIETNWNTSSMEGKLKYMETYWNIIEEVRPMGTVVDESVDHDWTWRQLTGAAGSLMNMIVFMIRKATGQSSPLAASNELRGKMREVRNLLAIGVPVPHAFLARRNRNSLLASGVRSLEVEQPGWWDDCLAEDPTDSEHCDNWDLHLHEIKDAAVWDDDGVEGGGCNPATLYAGRLNIDWLVNLAFFARRYDCTVRQITVLAE